MRVREEYRLHIDAYSIESIPMSRLAEYMAQLANLLGEKESVHFDRLQEGSVNLIATIEEEAIPKVERRAEAVRFGNAPADALRAFADIDNMLADDNATGEIMSNKGAIVIQFPGRNRPKPVRYGPFWEHGSIDGELIRLGGKDKTVPVHLKDGEVVHKCTSSVEMSKSLAKYYLNGILRVKGKGKWMREANGTWILEDFNIDSFECLDASPLSEAVEKLRAVKGSKWSEMSDPLEELTKIRGSDGNRH